MEDLKIIGEVEDIIYRNKDNGYTVFSLTTEDDEVTCVGVVPQIHSGEALEIHGSWTMHPLYGRQVQVQYYEKSMPTTTAGMEKYLSSGMIKGIGAKTAKRIVERFGDATFYVIEETRLGASNYLLVADSDDEDAECLILKDTSRDEDPEAVYELVEDETELDAVSKVFEELLSDEDITIE